jgi:hypothetical protein
VGIKSRAVPVGMHSPPKFPTLRTIERGFVAHLNLTELEGVEEEVWDGYRGVIENKADGKDGEGSIV